MPSYAQPSVPRHLAALVNGLGINQVRLAILVALADAGGTLDTTQITSQLQLATVTALRNLSFLEQAGYVTSSAPPEQRKGGRRAVFWTIQQVAVDDLLDLAKAITPKPQLRIN